MEKFLVGVWWLVFAVGDRLWFAIDHSIPSWDQADYLTGALNYWQAFQSPQWGNADWWQNLWHLSSKIPPGTYMITAIFHSFFGLGEDVATLVNLFFSAILLVSVYGLGCRCVNQKVGLWAAGLCMLFPGLYHVRLDFLLDYPLTAVVTLCFYLLTLWQFPQRKNQLSPSQWGMAIAFGLSLGLALMIKQTTVLFLLPPILWVIVGSVWRREWVKLAQLVLANLFALAVIYPWYRPNWLLILTGSKRATIDSALAEGDPPLDTFWAWSYYLEQLPDHVSWPILIVALAGYGWYIITGNRRRQGYAWQWLLVFWLGAYLLCSLNINKDFRYVLPYLPVVAIFLANGLLAWQSRSLPWGRKPIGKLVPLGTIAVALLLMIVNLWPVADWSRSESRQPGQHHAYIGPVWPVREVIAEIIHTEPDLTSTLGVLPSTPAVNQHTLNYYGALANFQVYGRQVGVRQAQVAQDVRSLSWFLTKTGDQGSVPAAQAATVQAVQSSPDFRLHKTWDFLPDGSTWQLYHRQSPIIQVKTTADYPSPQIKLENVTLGALTAPPGQPVAVSYEWSGNWTDLQNGLVLLTWELASRENQPQPITNYDLTTNNQPITNNQTNYWLHDHAIGLGKLYGTASNSSKNRVSITEALAMLPPEDIAPGVYTLKAQYLNRQTGATYPLAVPHSVQIKIDPTAAATPAPELDLVTQLRSLATALPKGTDALGPIFDDIARINQYDPIQDYLTQAQLTLKTRLSQEDNLPLTYNLALAMVLKRDAPGAIAALEKVVQLDPENPYAYGYLAFVNLYDWRPLAAEKALKSALEIAPNRQEFQILYAIAGLCQGNLLKTWHRATPLLLPEMQKLIGQVVKYLITFLSTFLGAIAYFWGRIIFKKLKNLNN